MQFFNLNCSSYLLKPSLPALEAAVRTVCIYFSNSSPLFGHFQLFSSSLSLPRVLDIEADVLHVLHLFGEPYRYCTTGQCRRTGMAIKILGNINNRAMHYRLLQFCLTTCSAHGSTYRLPCFNLSPRFLLNVNFKCSLFFFVWVRFFLLVSSYKMLDLSFKYIHVVVYKMAPPL